MILVNFLSVRSEILVNEVRGDDRLTLLGTRKEAEVMSQPPTLSETERLGLSYSTLDVFTKSKYAGNPLAVVEVPAGLELLQEQKQAIAREFNYSETVFLHERGGGDAKGPWTIDIFTPEEELPFAGHPTIGTACHVLSTPLNPNEAARTPEASPRTASFSTKAGIIDLKYDPAEGIAEAMIPHNTHRHKFEVGRDALLEMQPTLKGYPNLPSSCSVFSIVKGMTFVLVGLESLDALGALLTGHRPPRVELDKDWESFVGTYYYAKIPHSDDGTTHLRTRMLSGSQEDPATGSAACALASFLFLQEGTPDKKRRYKITQGVEMGRRSDIGVDITLSEGGAINSIVLSGSSVEVMRGTLKL